MLQLLYFSINDRRRDMAGMDSEHKLYSEDEDFFFKFEISHEERVKGLDDYEKKRKKRVGKRIRTIRETKGITRAELAEKIGLNSDRLQKYENGAQIPRSEMIIKIADELGVNVLSLVDPVAMDATGALYIMFEMEHEYQAQIEDIGDAEKPKMALTFGDDTQLYKYLRCWCLWKKKIEKELKDAQSEEEKADINRSYLDWQWNVPLSLYEHKKAINKLIIKSEIDRLQKLYDEADE